MSKNSFPYQREFEFAKNLALRTGKIIENEFHSQKKIAYKADKSAVTETDKRINSLAIKELSNTFNYPVIGEEESTIGYGEANDFWLCDPIDGTRAFIYGIATCMFSLALLIDKKPVLGIAYNPFFKHMYVGKKNNGSFLNNQRLHVSGISTLNKAAIAVGSDVPQILRTEKIMNKLLENNAETLIIEGAVFKTTSLAAGKLDGYIADTPKPHDIAAAQVILEEAGGKLTDLYGHELDYSKDFSGAVASNGKLHQSLIQIAQEEKQSPN